VSTSVRPIYASTILAIVVVIGFVVFAVIDFMVYPWPEFAAWAILAVVALLLSSVNLVRYRSVRFLSEVVAEVFVLATFQGRLLHLFGRAG
jgi:hypothetical protein